MAFYFQNQSSPDSDTFELYNVIRGSRICLPFLNMVYRGKPSAGCENCRKAKKKCTLEQPACTRCLKLNKQCSGYRDTTGLQIQDETLSVTRKAERKNAQASLTVTSATPQSKSRTATPAPDRVWDAEASMSQGAPDDSQIPAAYGIGKRNTPSLLSTRSSTPLGIPTPRTIHSESSSSSEGTLELPRDEDTYVTASNGHPAQQWPNDSTFTFEMTSLPRNILPKADEIAVSYFLNCFTANGHWDHILNYAALPNLDPCLTLSIRACGMAAFENIRNVPHGREWSRNMYLKAIGLLNEALRDPKRSKSDESLIAVTMLSFFENLVCDSKQSIQSWKAHIAGATQLLKLRGKAQFKTSTGRGLFRETRAQIMIACIWDDLEPPSFLVDWNEDLQAGDTDPELFRPADAISDICYDYGKLENRMKLNKISDEDAMTHINEIDTRMVQWSIDTLANESRWQYFDLQVDDSPHVWNGMVHSYVGFPSPGVWNMYRGVRIMVTRTQELLAQRFHSSPTARQAQHSYFRAIRRQLTDEICATVPVALGHAQPAFSSPCVLVTAYNSIWPLFFAGTCVLERIGQSAGNISSNAGSSAAMAQLAWILGRFDFISQEVGLRWADGVAATLRGDFKIHDNIMPTRHEREEVTKTPELQRMLDDGHKRPAWVVDIEDSGRGPRVLIEGDRDLPRGPGGYRDADDGGPKWLGRLTDDGQLNG